MSVKHKVSSKILITAIFTLHKLHVDILTDCISSKVNLNFSLDINAEIKIKSTLCFVFTYELAKYFEIYFKSLFW